MARLIDSRLLRWSPVVGIFLAGAGVLALATAVVVIAQAWLLAQIVVAVFLRGSRLAQVMGPMSFLIAVFAARAALSFTGAVAGSLCARRVKASLRDALLRHTLELGPAFLKGERTGELAATATSGLDALDPYFSGYLPQLTMAAIVPAVAIAWAFRVDPISGAILLVTVPLVPLFAALSGLAARARARRQWKTLAFMSAHFLDVVEGLPTLRVFGRARLQTETIQRVADTYRQATMRSLRMAFVSALVLELAASMATALVAVAIGIRLAQGTMALEAGLAVLVLVPDIFLPLRRVGAAFHSSAEGMAAAGRVLSLLEQPVSPCPSAGGRGSSPYVARPLDLSRQTIRLERVSVSYPGRGNAMRGVDLAICPGEWLAITGPSGSGKSTLIAVLLRMVEPSGGLLTLDESSVAGIAPAVWRAQIAWMPQHPYLFSGTLAENVRLGRPFPDAVVRAALDQAGLSRWRQAQPEGLYTQVGERGERLSAGERRRVALARALIATPSLLLLDEPTAGLDPITAAKIVRALQDLPQQPAIVIATHSAAMERFADRVVRLGEGEVLEVIERRPRPARPTGGLTEAPS